MKPANLCQLELAAALANRRALMARLAMPLLLALPFVLVAMPPRVQAAGLVMLLLFVAMFGAAVAMVRRRTDGRLARLKLLPIPRALVVLDLLLASVAVDLLQSAGVFALYVLVNAPAPTAGSILVLAGWACAVIVLLNALGMLLAAVARSNAEVHLYSALAVGLVAVAAGLFPLPGRIAPLVRSVAAWNPVARLADALAAMARGAPVGASRGSAVAAACALAVVLAAVAVRALGRPRATRGRETAKKPDHSNSNSAR